MSWPGISGLSPGAQAGANAPYRRRGLFTPIRVATYGDSRSNLNCNLLATTDTGWQGEKVAQQLAARRGDMLLVWNGGSSGDTAANWNSAARIAGSQAVTDCIAATPDIVLIQYGINDCIAGTAAATTFANLKALVNELLGAGIFVVFESIHTAATGPATYINGYGSAGGYSSTTTPAEYNARLAIQQSINSSMQTWMATFPGRGIYVDTNTSLAQTNGFAKTDGTYYDGTHVSSVGARVAAALIDAALVPYFGRGLSGKPLAGLSRNAVNDGLITVSSGRASGYSAGITETGTLAYSYQVTTDTDGEAVQEYTITNTTAANTAARARLEIVPTFIGAATYPVLAAADAVQASIDVWADNGSGGAPVCHTLFTRARIYYDDASNEYVQAGNIAQLASTDHPNYSTVAVERHILPRRAIKAAKANANIVANTTLQVFVCMNQPGTVRVRLKRATWRKVA